MKKNIFIISLILTFIGFSCKKAPLTNGETITETRQLTDFNSIYLYNNIDVTMIKSDEFKIEITTGDNLISNIISDVVDNTLYVRNENTLNWIRSYDYPLTARIYFRDSISRIIYESVGKLESEGYISNDTLRSFQLTLMDGSGDINLNVNTKYLNLFVRDDCTNNIRIKGSSNNAYINHRGFGPLHTEDMKIRKMQVHSYSYNNIYINCSDTLNANIHESGNIYYKGHPEISLKISPNAQGKLISLED